MALPWSFAGVPSGTAISSSKVQDNFNALDVGVFNIMRYGAKVDGSTDDTTAIQNAFTAADSAGGGVVYCPAGTAMISAQIMRGLNPVTFRGSGLGVSIIKALPSMSFNGGAMVASVSSSASKHHCFDLTFDVNGANLTTVPANTTTLHLVNGSIVQRCEFKNRIGNPTLSNTNFHLFVNQNDWEVSSCYFHDDVAMVNTTGTIGGTGSQVVTPASMAGIIVNSILTVDSAGVPETVYVTAKTSTTFTATFIVAHLGTVSIKGGTATSDCIGGGSTSLSVLSQRGVVANNRFENLLSDAYQRTDAHGDLISGNRVLNCQAGILVQGGSGHRVTSNFVDATLRGIQSESTLSGVAVNYQSGSPDTYDCVVESNVVVCANISVPFGSTVYARGLIVANNIIESPPGAGISVANVQGLKLSGNVIRNPNAAGYSYQPGGSCGTAGIYLFGTSDNISCLDNDVIDDRGTHKAQNGYSIDSAGVTNVRISGGTVSGLLNLPVENAGSTSAHISSLKGYNPVGVMAGVAVPDGIGNPYHNYTGVDQTWYVSGGTVTIIQVNGVTTGLTSGSISVPAGSNIEMAYSVAPTQVVYGA